MLIVTLRLLISSKEQTVLLFIGSGIFLISAIFCQHFTSSCQRQQKLIESDIQQGYLWRFEGHVIDTEHRLVKIGLLKNDLNRVQKVEVLPISGKIHRTNNSLLWTWFNI